MSFDVDMDEFVELQRENRRLLEQLEAAANDASHFRLQLADAEREVSRLREALAAIKEHRCNGCRVPQRQWGPMCPGMTQGDATHYHSPEWWVSRALSNPATEPSL